MSKYIRTKDGRIITYDENSSKEDLPMILNYKNQIIAQADTIEELCDEFVVINNNCFNTPILVGIRIDKEYYKNEIVYGAIWTDKGLIYVAKMNNDGVLELI